MRDSADDESVLAVSADHLQPGRNAGVRAGDGVRDYVWSAAREVCWRRGRRRMQWRRDESGTILAVMARPVSGGILLEISGCADVDGMLRGDDVRIELPAVDGRAAGAGGFVDAAGLSDGEVRNLCRDRDGGGDAGASGELGITLLLGVAATLLVPSEDRLRIRRYVG